MTRSTACATDCTPKFADDRVEIWVRDGRIMGSHVRLRDLPKDGVVVLEVVSRLSIPDARQFEQLQGGAETYSQPRGYMDAKGTRRCAPKVP